MAKAVCRVKGSGTQGDQVLVDYEMSFDGPVGKYVESVAVDFARSITQLIADIKAHAITTAAERSVVLSAGDIVLFGGPV